MAEWIGVDLDGTLAEYHGWKGVDDIGEPIPKMVEKVKQLLDEGKDVRIFTARVHDNQSKKMKERAIHWIEKWCLEVFDQKLPITCEKDTSMKTCYDDRATQVLENTGIPLEDIIDEFKKQTSKDVYDKIVEKLSPKKKEASLRKFTRS